MVLLVSRCAFYWPNRIQKRSFFFQSKFLDRKSRVFSFGSSLSGQLGHGNNAPCKTPKEITDLGEENIYLIGCMETSTVAIGGLESIQKIFVLGEPKEEEKEDLSVRKDKKSKPTERLREVNSFQRKKDSSLDSIKSLRCGQYHALALLDSGKVLSWGGGKEGQLGHGNLDNLYSTTALIESLKNEHISSVACGWLHSLAVSENGDLFSWGCSHFNQLGHDSYFNETLPKRVRAFSKERVLRVAAGLYHTLVLTENNGLFGFGRNSHGQLGDQKHGNQIRPISIPGDEEVEDVYCGMFHSVILTKRGILYSMGNNEYGQLGVGNEVNQLQFQPIIFSPDYIVKRVVCAPFHNLAFTETSSGDYDTWSWGLNFDFQLGLGDQINQCVPKKIEALQHQKLLDFSGGWSHSVVVCV